MQKSGSITLLLFLFIISFPFSDCSAQVEKPKSVVTIGTEVWDTKNLAVITFANGDKIEQVHTNEDWIKAGEDKRPA